RCGDKIASCKALAGVPELLLAGWLTPSDAVALVRSPYLGHLRSLTLYIGATGDESMCRALVHLPALRDLRLVQMWGGADTDDPQALDRRADELATLVRQHRPEWQVRVERPFRRRFPLDGLHIGYDLDAGYLPNGQPVLVVEGRQILLIHFDA